MEELNLSQLKTIEINLLTKLDQLCKENGIHYFLHAGSLLGAARHHGFIPWDDDIDISMMRTDYNKFIELSKKNDFGVDFICFENDSSYTYSYGKICARNTLVVENDRKNREIGVFIDVFPLDTLPNNYKKAYKHVKKCRLYTWLVFTSTENICYQANSRKVRICKKMIYPIVKKIGYKFWIKQLNKVAQKYNGINSQYLSNCFSPNYTHVFQSKWYQISSELPFEEQKFSVPFMWDDVLKCMYKDYSKLPPVEKQVTHHDFIAYRR